MSLPPLISNLNTPKIKWYQTDVFVTLLIQLIDVQKYYLRIDRDRLNFSTTLKDTNYYVIINLFGAVIPEESIHKNTGREIKIHIPKGHKGTEWSRLHLEQEKNPMIVVDPDRVLDSELRKPVFTNFDVNRFQEYKKRHNISNIRPDEPPSEEEDSDDELFDSYFD